jgi:2-oxoglutarate ferredoxin oxidoreductase subunit alpha
MTNLRSKKIKNIQNELNEITITGPENGDLLVIGWGSTNGPISEAQEQLANKGYKISHVHVSCLWPISERLKNLAPQFESIIVVEMNDGQLFNLLKAESVQKLQSLTQVSGKPIRVSYLLEKFQKILKSGK